MTEHEFNAHIESLKSELKGQSDEVKDNKLKALTSTLTVKEYEQTLLGLKAENLLSTQQYEMWKKNYMVFNKYLMLYGIGSRIFGEIWAIQQLKGIDIRFKDPDKALDPLYRGDYDLSFEGVKIAARACRSVNVMEEGDRFAMAMHYDTRKSFTMHFRQFRIEYCDILVLIGVWMDKMVYWAFPCNEIKENKYFIRYKEEEEAGSLVINEKNIADFEKFRIPEPELVKFILEKEKF